MKSIWLSDSLLDKRRNLKTIFCALVYFLTRFGYNTDEEINRRVFFCRKTQQPTPKCFLQLSQIRDVQHSTLSGRRWLFQLITRQRHGGKNTWCASGCSRVSVWHNADVKQTLNFTRQRQRRIRWPWRVCVQAWLFPHVATLLTTFTPRTSWKLTEFLSVGL